MRIIGDICRKVVLAMTTNLKLLIAMATKGDMHRFNGDTAQTKKVTKAGS
jgi:hypothetical protein